MKRILYSVFCVAFCKVAAAEIGRKLQRWHVFRHVMYWHKRWHGAAPRPAYLQTRNRSYLIAVAATQTRTLHLKTTATWPIWLYQSITLRQNIGHLRYATSCLTLSMLGKVESNMASNVASANAQPSAPNLYGAPCCHARACLQPARENT